MEIIRFNIKDHEGITQITDQVKDYVAKNRIKDGLVMLHTPEKSTAVTFADPLDPQIEKEFILKMNKMMPRYDGMRFGGWSTMNIKASIVGQALQVMVQGGELVLGIHQGIYAADFEGGNDTERVIFVSHIGTTLAEDEVAQMPEILAILNKNQEEKEAQQKAEEEQAVKEMREEYNARLQYMQEHPEDDSVRSDRQLF